MGYIRGFRNEGPRRGPHLAVIRFEEKFREEARE